MEASPDVGDHWRKFAYLWSLLGSPLRPCAEDVEIFGELVADTGLIGNAGEKQALLLGITPELATAPWLQAFRLIAVEQSRAMIDGVWPGNNDHRKAVCADWSRAPFSDGSFDLAVSDGCMTSVGFPDELARLLASVQRCLRRDGYLLLRLFCRPDVPESPEAVLAALRSGAIGNFHAFKWRLAMAIQGMADGFDVAVDQVWKVWNATDIDTDKLAKERGWPPGQVSTIESYRGSTARYNFMRFGATIGRLQEAGFELVAKRTGSYELAERCPIVLLRKRSPEEGAGTP
jgi:SAM-dependent methyltransferase